MNVVKNNKLSQDIERDYAEFNKIRTSFLYMDEARSTAGQYKVFQADCAGKPFLSKLKSMQSVNQINFTIMKTRHFLQAAAFLITLLCQLQF